MKIIMISVVFSGTFAKFFVNFSRISYILLFNSCIRFFCKHRGGLMTQNFDFKTLFQNLVNS